MFRAWDKTSTDGTDQACNNFPYHGFQMTFKNGHTVSVVWNDNQTRAEVARSPNYGEAGEGWTVVTPTASPNAVAKYIQEIAEDDDVDPLGLTDDDVS